MYNDYVYYDDKKIKKAYSTWLASGLYPEDMLQKATVICSDGKIKSGAVSGKVASKSSSSVAAPKNLRFTKVKSGDNYPRLKWDKVSGAVEYMVTITTGKKSETFNVTSKSNSTANYGMSTFTSSAKYTFYVSARDKYGNYSQPSEPISLSLPGLMPELKIKKKSAGSITVSWEKDSNADGYQVLQRTDSGKEKIVATVNDADTVKADIKAAPGKEFYYSVRAWKKIDKSTYYSQWNAPAAFKLK